MKKIIIYLIFSTLTFSCNSAIVEYPPCNENNPCAQDACHPEDCVQDSTFLGLDTLWSLSMESMQLKHILQDDDNLYLNFLTSSSFKILGISKKGEMKWEYSNSLVNATSSFDLSLRTNNLIGKRWNSIYRLNPENGQEELLTTIQLADPATSEGYIIDDEYFTCVRLQDESEAYIINSNLNDLQNWKIVYTLTSDQVNGSRPNAVSINKWTHPTTGDKILVFQHRMAFPKRIDLVAYNMTADSIYWWHKDIDPEGNSNIKQINISQGKAFYMGHSTLSCYDIESGDLIWSHYYPMNSSDDRGFILGDIVFTKDKNTMVVIYHEGMMALNIQTGREIWHKTDDLWNVGSRLSIYKDIIFFTHPGDGEFHSNTLWAINAHSGEELWRKSSFQYGVGGFRGPVAIDKDEGILYTYGSRLYAIKIPEEW